MKALSLSAIRKPRLVSQRSPANPKRGWALVKVTACGICGSDVLKFNSQIEPSKYLKSKILGHEIAGVIHKVGQNKQGFKQHDRVVALPLIHCGKCGFCRQGNYEHCVRLKSLGKDLPGGFAEYVAVPLTNLRLVPPTVGDNAAALTDVVAVAVHASHMIYPRRGKFLVLGDGPVALMLVSILARDNPVTLVGKNIFNLRLAKKLGAVVLAHERLENLPSNSFDCIFECVGRKQSYTIEQAVRLVAPLGAIVVLGVYEIGYRSEFVWRNLFYKEAELIGSNSYGSWRGRDEFDTALKMMASHRIHPELLVTHELPLDSFPEALELIKNREFSHAIKVIIKPGL